MNARTWFYSQSFTAKTKPQPAKCANCADLGCVCTCKGEKVMPFVPSDRYAELLTAESQLAALEAMFCESHMDTDVQNHNIGDGCLLCKYSKMGAEK